MLALALALQVTTTCYKVFDRSTCRTYGLEAGPVLKAPPRTAFLPKYEQRVPTPRELYIGCSLLGAGTDVPNEPNNLPPFSAGACLLAAASVYERNAAMPVNERRFCPPATAPINEMAATYRKLYETLPTGREAGDALILMTAASVTKWPCLDRYRSSPK